VLPYDFLSRYAPAEQELALQHESIHHRRGDLWWNLVALGLARARTGSIRSPGSPFAPSAPIRNSPATPPCLAVRPDRFATLTGSPLSSRPAARPARRLSTQQRQINSNGE
jgi:hypothetical protein